MHCDVTALYHLNDVSYLYTAGSLYDDEECEPAAASEPAAAASKGKGKAKASAAIASYEVTPDDQPQPCRVCKRTCPADEFLLCDDCDKT